MNNAKHYQTKTFLFRGEIIGFVHVFDFDIEIVTDLENEIIDHSGCGLNTAEKLMRKLKNK